ncbi:MAG: sigma 54-interacting transcriptional regulator, partial [Myxococcales bacterium]
MALLDPAVLIGESPGMVALRATVTRLLERESPAHRLPPILLLGETGTGKSLLAREIHRLGPRNEHPFIGVSCAAIPEGLLEAELFGFEQGAFTDARQGKPGLFHAADRGTLFLDEIGALSTGLQAKLLTVIDEQLVRRLGSTRSEPVSVNVISATNDDLTRLVAERRFREDLYYRLSTLVLQLPPLRRRGDDILLLARHLLAKVCSKHGLSARTLTDDACRALLGHGWPGNVRELANVIERAVLLTTGPSIAARELALGSGRHAGEGVAPPSGEGPAVGPERDRLRALLREVG